MNFKIAICDDESIICTSLYSLINKIAETKHVNFEIDCFASGEELCAELQSVKYDLVFLDIELAEMNGVAVGKFIREQLHNENIQIAFISSKQDYAMELFEVRPINFLVKPLTENKIKKIIDKFLLLNKLDKEAFTFKKGHSYNKIQLSDIEYFYSTGRKVIIVTFNQSMDFYSTLNRIYERIKQQGFLYVHKSFIVNYKYIKKYEYEQITMKDDSIIPISQSHRKDVRFQFMKLREAELN